MLYIMLKSVNTALCPFLSTSQEGEKNEKKLLRKFYSFFNSHKSLPFYLSPLGNHINHWHIYVTIYLLGWRFDHSQPGFQA